MNRNRPAAGGYDEDSDDGDGRALVNFCIAALFKQREAALRALVTVDRIRNESLARFMRPDN